MKGLRLVSVTAVMTVGLAVPALAAELPNVKLGLWEMTVSVQMKGMPSVDLSKVPADKQAMAQFGSSDSGASLGDILGAAISRATKEKAKAKGKSEPAGEEPKKS